MKTNIMPVVLAIVIGSAGYAWFRGDLSISINRDPIDPISVSAPTYDMSNAPHVAVGTSFVVQTQNAPSTITPIPPMNTLSPAFYATNDIQPTASFTVVKVCKPTDIHGEDKNSGVIGTIPENTYVMIDVYSSDYVWVRLYHGQFGMPVAAYIQTNSFTHCL